MLAPIPALQEWFNKRYAPLIAFCSSQLASSDPVIMGSINCEIRRQTTAINLVASESLASLAVMAASASPGYVQTVEGTIGNRWYPFVDGIDALEMATEERAKALFGLPQANVQPHSATQANQAVYLSVLEPGQTILSMAFTSGAHLSHGFSSSLARRLYNVETYSVPSFGEKLSLEELEKRIQEKRPSLIIAGSSAYPREIPFYAISQLAQAYGARFLADISHTAGLVASGIHPSIAFADFCTMSLHKTMCGPRAGIVLCQSQFRKELDKAVFPGVQGAVFPSLVAARAACLKDAESESFKTLQADIVENARAMADVLLAHDIDLFTGGTDTHLLVVRRDPSVDSRIDVSRLLEIGILTNPNYVHGDELGTNRMSGIRIGTTWITQVGFKARHAAALAAIVAEVLKSSDQQHTGLRQQVSLLVEDVFNAAA